MNLRNVLRAYSLLRQLSDDETALLETLRAMNDSERDLLVESLSPAQKKSSKKAAGKAGNTRQRRGLGQSLASIAQNVGGNNARQVLDGMEAATADDGNDSDSSLCIEAVDSKGETCGESADHNVHHLSTHPDYHEFKAYTPPARSAAGTGNST